MVWFSLGTWSSWAGRWFIYERLYSSVTGKPTCLVRVSLRYLKTQWEIAEMKRKGNGHMSPSHQFARNL